MKLESVMQDQLAAIVADEGLELIATEVAGSGSKAILRLVVDGPEGVNLDQCASISRQASVALDVEDPIRHHTPSRCPPPVSTASSTVMTITSVTSAIASRSGWRRLFATIEPSPASC